MDQINDKLGNRMQNMLTEVHIKRIVKDLKSKYEKLLGTRRRKISWATLFVPNIKVINGMKQEFLSLANDHDAKSKEIDNKIAKRRRRMLYGERATSIIFSQSRN